jgi:hypothetical protein
VDSCLGSFFFGLPPPPLLLQPWVLQKNWWGTSIPQPVSEWGPVTFENWSMYYICNHSPFTFFFQKRMSCFLCAFSPCQSWLIRSKYSGDTSDISTSLVFMELWRANKIAFRRGYRNLPFCTLFSSSFYTTSLVVVVQIWRGEVVSVAVPVSIWWYNMKIYASHFPCTQSQFGCHQAIIMETVLGEQTTLWLYLGFHMMNFPGFS